ncbi:Aryl-alcohol dehydrogenase [Lasiodiplodia theobromae]|uniref:Versiconal hemiacetal acetate reductase n=1 Tax=Lasiodiplodia theobromae TaxID=45133 RepID=A0A5N5DNB5_9PEZI|nr:Aryl-alcohol dehydrogenase [Lasiodiplodia theobromae]KAB2579415.1 Versiconal hemiacetal acetate reductase [Lasiodiplodia theobromae]KAF4542192.1 Aryl-alcohol dehydrogenase [Lasiodiplodia theobromae]
MAAESKMQYVNLGKSGLKVSKVILGAMSYGSSEWQKWVLDEAEALPLLKHAYDNGINTWDTADIYSHGRSEEIIGKALKQYAIPREKVVILSKCYFGVAEDGTQPPIAVSGVNDGADLVNRVGLSRKHILDAVDKSVARLGTYIDVLQIHRLDRGTPMEEIMRALNDVVESGKVRYIGASSMAAWEFQMLQNIAATHGWHKFISMQNYHNLLYREEEREMIPYCRATGVGIIPWSPIARGVLARPFDSRGTTVRDQTDNFLNALIRAQETETDAAVVGRVEELAKKRGVTMAAVATAWVLSKGECPIIGLSTKDRIEEAVRNSNFVLSEDEIKYLEEPYRPKTIAGY